MTGEKTSSSTEPREVRRFGLAALVFFGLLAGLGIWRAKPLVAAVFGALAAVGFLLLALPGPAAPLYRGWMAVAHRIGKTVTTLVLTLAYFLVITPAALIKRIFGGRPLPLRPDPKRESYWLDRSEPAQPAERFPKRY
ncbi:MAG: hypothetical protein PVG78_04645 [Desulfobacterales bacterium]|jgi:hypothetical protein